MRFFLSIVAASAAVFLVSAAPEHVRAASPCEGEVPPPLAVPSGNELAFAVDADGAQVYACTAGAGGAFGWVFQAPEAKLSEPGGPAAGTHYAGPTWESTDGSKVVGAKVEAATPDATAIPWLLLRAASHAGNGRMAEVTFVQRVRTSGGNPPQGGCDAAHAGAVSRVPYRAVYCFYRKAAGARG
jgi:hypothetical protein